jgi:hypothetical protein
MTSAPEFRSAVIDRPDGGGALPRRRFGRGFALSIASHVALCAWLVVLALSDLGGVPPPPMTVSFFVTPPPAPALVPLREARPPEPPPRPKPLPIRPPAEPALRFEALRPEPVRPAPPKLEVAPDPVPIRIADAAPELKVHDVAPAPAATALAPLGAPATPQIGANAEPELEYLVPGKAHARSSGGGVADRSSLAVPPAGDPLGSIRKGGAGAPGGSGTVDREGAFTGAGLASFLGKRYGVTLTDANRLGARTSDGAEYSMLVPALSEATRAVRFRGRRAAPAGDPVESLQADGQAVVIRYRDGTVQVLAPTPDGLVALFVSAAVAAGRTKVQEAERALRALQRLAPAGARG